MILLSVKKIATNKMIMPANPNSCPLNGNTPKTVVADPIPIRDVKTTDPHDAQPTPIRLVIIPAKETPISVWILID